VPDAFLARLRTEYPESVKAGITAILGLDTYDKSEALMKQIATERETLAQVRPAAHAMTIEASVKLYQHLAEQLTKSGALTALPERVTFFYPGTTLEVQDRLRTDVPYIPYTAIYIKQESFTNGRLGYDLARELLDVQARVTLPHYYELQLCTYAPEEKDRLKRFSEGANLTRTLAALRPLGTQYKTALKQALEDTHVAVAAVDALWHEVPPLMEAGPVYNHRYFSRSTGLAAMLTALHGDKALDEVFSDAATRTE
jgi:hypothetical protein